VISPNDPALQLALDRGLVTPAQVALAQAKLDADGKAAVDSRTALRRALCDEGALDTGRLADALADEFSLPRSHLAGQRIADEVMTCVPREFAVERGVFPIARQGPQLQVATCDPTDTEALDELAFLADLEIAPAVADVHEIEAAIERSYERGDSPVVSGDAAYDGPADGEADDAPIIRLVESLIADAIARRASDIHLEPLEKRLRVRHRIDGVLREAVNPPKRLQPAIVSRLKIMADISIAEKRVPQDGRIRLVLGGRAVDLRVSSLPTIHGESLVLRILEQESLRLDLSELGFLPDHRAAFEQVVAAPHGIVLVTGPTGSGKTTTLYSCLHHLNQSDRKIITVEDPIEHQLSGINQVPVRADIGMTFASALRAMLRQAPNIVMVGEVRDAETAEVAINASLTGHMVFSTLHTNDAAGAIARLADLGAKPFLLASSLRAVLAQRLVRKVCPHCRGVDSPTPAELNLLGISPAEAAGATFAKGTGCAQCSGTGFRGRIGIFELLVIDEEFESLIATGASVSKLREKARRLGVRTLRADGARKVIAGLTTADEVVSITVDDPA
jgi:type IV pilus assembly protein PilB